MEKTKLTLAIIESFGFKQETYQPDYDDKGHRFTLWNGVVLESLFMCNGEPCESDMLEGMDGYICIDTKEELMELSAMEYEKVLDKLERENEDFNREDFE